MFAKLTRQFVMVVCGVGLGLSATTSFAQASLAKQATPKDARIWAGKIHQNYPFAALRDNAQGSVRLVVSVDPEGRVSKCFVTQSSGHEALDKAACDGMVQFAMFDPARDEMGRPVAGSYATVITYRFKTQPPVPAGPTPPAITI
ncbi:energy transducer TonB [Porphyrobacter sp. AAP60]|uniref:energy transducer TonB n=1 Tax=Porphyrobacter sp. AAP60 TaxID=1523423 RepID=UPI0009EA2763|nr:energy transducer TonB [Porphyrobacter sp. AAP60]